MQRCLTACRDTRDAFKISLRTSHHESVGWQALPWMYRRGPRSWSGRDLTFPSVTSKFCPMHISFYPTVNFLPPGVCLKTGAWGWRPPQIPWQILSRYTGRSYGIMDYGCPPAPITPRRQHREIWKTTSRQIFVPPRHSALCTPGRCGCGGDSGQKSPSPSHQEIGISGNY